MTCARFYSAFLLTSLVASTFFFTPAAEAQVRCSQALAQRESSSSLQARWDRLVYQINRLREPEKLNFSSEKVDQLKQVLNQKSIEEITLENKEPSLEMAVALSEIYASRIDRVLDVASLAKEQTRQGQALRILIGKFEKKETLGFEEISQFTQQMYWITHSQRLGFIESFKFKSFRDRVIQTRVETELYNKGVMDGLVALGIVQGPPQLSRLKRFLKAMNPLNTLTYSVGVNLMMREYFGRLMYLPMAYMPKLDITQKIAVPQITANEVLSGQAKVKIDQWKASLQTSARIDYGVSLVRKSVAIATSVMLLNFAVSYGPIYGELVKDGIQNTNGQIVLPLPNREVVNVNLYFFEQTTKNFEISDVKAYLDKIRSEVTEKFTSESEDSVPGPAAPPAPLAPVANN